MAKAGVNEGGRRDFRGILWGDFSSADVIVGRGMNLGMEVNLEKLH